VREIIGFGAWATLDRFSMALRDAADPIVLNKLAGAVAVNSFHVGLMIDRNARMLLSWVLIPFEPILTTMHARQETGRLRHAFVRATRIMLWLALLPTVPLIVFRNELVALYLGDALATYPDAPALLMLILLTYPSWYSVQVLTQVARARAEVRPFALRGLGAQGFGLGLALVLVGPAGMGASGAAVAALAARGVVRPALLLPLVPKLTGMSRRRFLSGAVLPGVGPAAVVGITAELVRTLVLPEGLVWWAPALVATIILQVAGIGLMLSPADRQDLWQVRKRLPFLSGIGQSHATEARS
jgi:O-antigen/teichoic acid export membrane protein